MITIPGHTYTINVLTAPVSIIAVAKDGTQETIATAEEAGQYEFRAQTITTVFSPEANVGLRTRNVENFNGAPATGSGGGGSSRADQDYDPTSTHAQSGVAVSQAIQQATGLSEDIAVAADAAVTAFEGAVESQVRASEFAQKARDAFRRGQPIRQAEGTTPEIQIENYVWYNLNPDTTSCTIVPVAYETTSENYASVMTLAITPSTTLEKGWLKAPEGSTLTWPWNSEPEWKEDANYIVEIAQTGPSAMVARAFSEPKEVVDQEYTPTSTNAQSGTAVSEGLALVNFRAALFEYPYCVATWRQFEEMNPNYMTDKIVFLPGVLEEPSTITLPNAKYVMLRGQGSFSSNSQPNQFPGGSLGSVFAPNADCLWIYTYAANVGPSFNSFCAKRVVIYSGSNLGVMNGALGWFQYGPNTYADITKNMVCEIVLPYQTSGIDFWGTRTESAIPGFPREWRIFLPSIVGNVALFTSKPYDRGVVPPVSKESILYLLNHVRKAVFSGTRPYIFSLALAADYFDENGELIDEELKAKAEEMSANYTISFVKSDYYL